MGETKRGAKLVFGGCMAALAGSAAIAAIAKNRQNTAACANLRGQTVLITGASGGIGLELARIFARNGANVVAVARSAEKLEKLTRELREDFGVHTWSFVRDLSVGGAAELLYKEVRDAGIEVDQLVNNAGAGRQARLVDADPQVLHELIELNITSVTLLTRVFGADMVARGHGRILTVSSLAGTIADPFLNVYGPTKAYELRLVESMYEELKGTGVTVSALCPGPVRTGWSQAAGRAESSFAVEPDVVAEEAFVGMQRGQLIIVPTPRYKFAYLLARIAPLRIQSALTGVWERALITRAVP